MPTVEVNGARLWYDEAGSGQALLLLKRLVVGVELGFQDSQTVELGEQQSGSFGHRAQRIVGLLFLPAFKFLLRGRDCRTGP